VCINDMTAIGAIHYFQSKGISVPVDISVIGFDNISVSEIVSPSITTVDQCIYQMGNMAVKMLIGNIENEKTDIASIEFQPSIVVRQSTKKI
jgi:LacI family transcriptional regulator